MCKAKYRLRSSSFILDSLLSSFYQCYSPTMLAEAGLKFAMTFLLMLVLIIGGLARCTMVDDLPIVANDASANLALPGEMLENDNDDGNLIASISLLQPCPFYFSRFATCCDQPLAPEPTRSKDSLEVYTLNRSLLI